ncbi:MAG: hypothetical protein ACRENA_00880 [Vulcanimicrobiaceae bacterium]
MIQQLTLTSFTPPHLGALIFPPQDSTLAGATMPPLARFGAAFLSSVLPTNQPQAVSSTLSQVPASTAGQPTSFGENAFAASYSPQIYAVYLNGLVANAGVSSAALETNTYNTDIAKPPILGDPPGPLPGLPPIQPVAAPEGAQQVIAALTPLAGGKAIFSGAPVQTGAVSTGDSQSSASRSSAPAVKK